MRTATIVRRGKTPQSSNKTNPSLPEPKEDNTNAVEGMAADEVEKLLQQMESRIEHVIEVKLEDKKKEIEIVFNDRVRTLENKHRERIQQLEDEIVTLKGNAVVTGRRIAQYEEVRNKEWRI